MGKDLYLFWQSTQHLRRWLTDENMCLLRDAYFVSQNFPSHSTQPIKTNSCHQKQGIYYNYYFHNDFLRNACWRGRENNFPPLVEINLEIWTTHNKARGGCQVWKKTPVQLEFRHNGGEEEQHPGLSQSHSQTLPSANQVGDHWSRISLSQWANLGHHVVE